MDMHICKTKLYNPVYYNYSFTYEHCNAMAVCVKYTHFLPNELSKTMEFSNI